MLQFGWISTLKLIREITQKKTLKNCRSAAVIVAFAFLRYAIKNNDFHLHPHGSK
jgi:hypothetical protein